MITIHLPATMTCDTDGCGASQPVSLYLLGSGGFAFKPDSAAAGPRVVLADGRTS